MAADHQRWQTSPLRTAERSSTASSGAAEARTYELHGLMCGGGVAEIESEFGHSGGVAEIGGEFGRSGGRAELDRLVPRARRGQSWRRKKAHT